MTKKKVGLLAFSCAAVLSATMLSGCDRSQGQSGAVSIESGKTQLYVRYTNGGLRREWLDNVVANFEKDYASHSFEEGKVGIQIVPDYSKKDVTADAIGSSPDQVFLMESADYLNFKSKNCLADLTDLVQTGAETGDGTAKETATIESKIRDDAKKFYNLGTTDAPKYYGLPFYESTCTLNYNIDVFTQRGFYFAKGKSADDLSAKDLESGTAVSTLFVSKTNTEKSDGPDGKAGTFDDGLPATYADFEALITYIRASGQIPFVWNGYETGYLTSLILGAWANAVGAEQMKLSLTWDGTAQKMLKLGTDNKPTKDSSGNYVYDTDTPITSANAYKLHQQKGCLDALNFAHLIVANSANYYEKSFSTAFSHTTAQEYFIKGKEKGYVDKDLAMLNEGTWWNSEANSVYTDDADRLSHNFGVLPYPHPTKAQIGEKQVLLSDRNSMIFINANTKATILPAAKTFVSYLQSDRSMNTFSRYTDMVRAMKYTLTDETKTGMSPFGRNVYELFSSDDTEHIEWEPLSQITAKNSTIVGYRYWGFSTSTNNNNPIIQMAYDSSLDAESYFANVNSYFAKNWTAK